MTVTSAEASRILQRLAALDEKLETVLRAVRQLHLADAPALDAASRTAVDAIGDVFGAGAVQTGEILAAARLDIGARPAMRAALIDLVGHQLAPQRLGLELRRICAAGGRGDRWQLAAPAKAGGARVWCIGGLEGV